jgi:nucleoside 2-deoxyribosyltransferase
MNNDITHKKCPVCLRYCPYTQGQNNVLYSNGHCFYCGHFQITNSHQFQKFLTKLTLPQKRVLSRNLALKTDDFSIILDSFEYGLFDVSNTTFDIIKSQSVSTFFPTKPLEQLDKLIFTIAELTNNLGETTQQFNCYSLCAVCMFDDAEHCLNVLNTALRMRLISIKDDYDQLLVNTEIKLMLTVEGWQYFEAKKKPSTKNKAFVAMWFHDELTNVYDVAIEPTLKELGFVPPFRVDRMHSDQKICDQILAGINESSLVICDITGANLGVYFEAGYALGQNKTVIWTCNSEWESSYQRPQVFHPYDTSFVPNAVTTKWIDQMHFDTRQYPHILWKDAADLKSKLTDRIKALGFGLNLETN